MEFTAPDGWTGKRVAKKLKRAMGRAHKAATLSYRKDGRLYVYQWLAGELRRMLSRAWVPRRAL